MPWQQNIHQNPYLNGSLNRLQKRYKVLLSILLSTQSLEVQPCLQQGKVKKHSNFVQWNFWIQ